MSNKTAKNTDTVWSPMVKIVAIICAVVLLATIALAVVSQLGVFRRNTVVMTVGDSEISALEFNYGYYSTLNEFYSQYYYYLSYIGFDTSTSLKNQTCYFDSTKSWYEYFVDTTKLQTEELYLLYNKAVSENFSLTEESKKTFEESIVAIEEAAKEAKMKVNKYLQSMYGPNITMDDYKEFVTRRLIAADFAEKYNDSLEYTDEKIESFYNEHKKDYDKVDYFAYEVKVNKDKDGDKTAETIANEIKDASKDQAAFIEAIKARENADTFKEETYLKDGVAYVKAETEKDKDATSEWLFDDARKAGDVTVIPKTSGSTTSYTVIFFLERGREEYKLATMRHILFMVEEETDDSGKTVEDKDGNPVTNDAEKKAEAEKIFAQWKEGDKTEDSFAALVKDNSDDEGSVETEGLYEDFDQNTMVQEITDWIWAEGRKEGDCEIVKTSYGYHIVYFVGYGDTKWNSDVVSQLKSDDYKAYVESLKKDTAISFNEKGLSQVG